jgi:hypothetical protein
MLKVFAPRKGFGSPGRGPIGAGSGRRDEAKVIDEPGGPLGPASEGLGGPGGVVGDKPSRGMGGREAASDGSGMNDVDAGLGGGIVGRELLSEANDQPDEGFDRSRAGSNVVGLGRRKGSGFGSGLGSGRGASGEVMAATRFFSLLRVMRMAITPASTHNRIKISDTPILVSLPMVNLLVDGEKVSGTVSSSSSNSSRGSVSSASKRFLEPFSFGDMFG